MLKAIIFDMDGVLVNSTPYNKLSHEMLLKELGFEPPGGNQGRFIGRSMRDTLKMWEAELGVKLPPAEEFGPKSVELQLKLMKDELRPKEEVLSLFREFKKCGLKLAVATSSMKKRAEKFLELLGVKEFLQVIIAAEDVDKHKPDPAVFLEAAKRLGVDPKNCVVIEDAVNGIQAAKRGGMKAVGLVTEFHTRKELAEADLVINSIEELSVEKLRALF